MEQEIAFDESSWSIIEQLLPDDVTVKTAVLEDFIWFMGRTKKYRSNKEKVEDYIRHLQLKANPVFDMKPAETNCFKCIDIERTKAVLQILINR